MLCNFIRFETESGVRTEAGVVNDSLHTQSSRVTLIHIAYNVDIIFHVEIVSDGVTVDSLDTHCRDPSCVTVVNPYSVKIKMAAV